MRVCPACKSEHIRILDKGLKKLYRFITGDNRWVCHDCNSTWRSRSPTRILKIKRSRTHSNA